MNKIYALLIVVGISIAAFFTRNFYHPGAEEPFIDEEEVHSSHIIMDNEKARLHGVIIKNAGPAKLLGQLSARGKVVFHPDRVAHILPKVSGVAKEARKNRGDFVNADEVLAVLESREIAEIKANYLAATQKKKLVGSYFEREKTLYEKKVTSEQDFLNAQANFDEALIQWQLARQKLFAFGLSEEDIEGQGDSDLRFYEIRSPISGIVIDREITFGEYIEDRTPIYTVADLDPVWVEIGLYPKDFQKVKEGQTVIVSYSGIEGSARGTITYISPMIDPETITAKAIVELRNEKKQWKPGSFVVATILDEPIIVPLAVIKNAVQMLDGEPTIFVKISDGFEGKTVRLGRSDEQLVEIVAGLDQGAPYASTGAFLLKADLGKDSVEHD